MNFSLGHKGSSVEEAADACVPALHVKVNGRRLLWDVLARIWQCGQTVFYSSPVSVFYYFSFLFNLSCKHSYSFCVCGCVVHICTPVCHSVCVWMCLHVCIIISTRGYLDWCTTTTLFDGLDLSSLALWEAGCGGASVGGMTDVLLPSFPVEAVLFVHQWPFLQWKNLECQFWPQLKVVIWD